MNRRGSVLLYLLVIAVGGYVLLARPGQAEPPPATPLPTAPPYTPTPLPRGDGRRAAFLDESVAWDWDAAVCGPTLAEYLAPYPAMDLFVVLEDLDRENPPPMAVAYPSLEHLQALVRGDCAMTAEGALSCRIQVAQGEPGSALDTAASAALGYAVWDVFRERTEEAWAREQARGWDWSRFIPLIRPIGGEQWQSACLQLFRP